jgi:diguanylate cyclase (GGDEF)-like protein
MDYTTSFVFFLFSLGLFTVVLFSLSLLDRSVIGARWLAASTLLDFTKTTLQGLDRYAPRLVTVCLANELNILSFVMMFLGLRWFVDRRPSHSPVGAALVATTMVAYPVMFVQGMRQWSFTVAVLPVLALCGILAWKLFRQTDERFTVPARLTAVFLTIHILAVAYRCRLSLRGLSGATAASPWADPRWMYSMLAIMLAAYCLLLMYALFTVMEMHSTVANAAGADALTGAMNRRSLMKQATREVARSERFNRPLAIVCMDLDNFKRVNDTHGHGGGDAALCAFVDLVKEQLRSCDLIARTGGEEFVLVLPGMDATGATRVAETLRHSLEQMRVHYDGRMIVMTASAGVTDRRPDDSLVTMLKRADSLLYRAKASGRNCVILDEKCAMLDEQVVQHAKPVLVERFGPRRQGLFAAGKAVSGK